MEVEGPAPGPAAARPTGGQRRGSSRRCRCCLHGFPSRKRQPHTNPVNAASSITYCGSDPHSVRANPQQGLDEPQMVVLFNQLVCLWLRVHITS